MRTLWEALCRCSGSCEEWRLVIPCFHLLLSLIIDFENTQKFIKKPWYAWASPGVTAVNVLWRSGLRVKGLHYLKNPLFETKKWISLFVSPRKLAVWKFKNYDKISIVVCQRNFEIKKRKSWKNQFYKRFFCFNLFVTYRNLTWR